MNAYQTELQKLDVDIDFGKVMSALDNPMSPEVFIDAINALFDSDGYRDIQALKDRVDELETQRSEMIDSFDDIVRTARHYT